MSAVGVSWAMICPSMAQALGLLHIVGGIDDAHAGPVQRLDALKDGVATLGVHTHRWLVQEEDLGLVQQPGTDVHPALHAARIVAHRIVGALGQADHLQYLVHPLAQLLALQAVDAAKEHQVLARREAHVQGHLLGDQAHLGLDLVGVGLEVQAIHGDLAAAGLEQPGEHRNRRRLAGAVGAQQAKHLAPRYLERDALHCFDLSEGLGQVLANENGLGHCDLLFWD